MVGGPRLVEDPDAERATRLLRGDRSPEEEAQKERHGERRHAAVPR
jgi:hypothetical protein